MNDQTQNVSRREFFKQGATGVAALAASAVALPALAQTATPATRPKTPAKPSGLATSDLQILNYALLLEFLEADFYTRSLAAHANRAYLTPRFATLAQSLRDHEVTHAQTLTQAITQGGGTPLESPQFQFPQDAFISPVFWATFASAMEETGVAAYLGQAGRLRSPALLQAAASIYGVEARHASILRLYGVGDPTPRLQERPLNSQQVVGLIGRYIVGGPPAGLSV